jgi:ribosome-associated heat shock protein Hsp15
MPDAPLTDSRIDKWLWAIRVFKSRSSAIDACKAGHVKVDGASVKPSHIVKINQTIEARVGDRVRIVKVLGFLDKRLSAKDVQPFFEDHSPVPDPGDRLPNFIPVPLRIKGTGRPTKKERRQLDSWQED